MSTSARSTGSSFPNSSSALSCMPRRPGPRPTGRSVRRKICALSSSSSSSSSLPSCCWTGTHSSPARAPSPPSLRPQRSGRRAPVTTARRGPGPAATPRGRARTRSRSPCVASSPLAAAPPTMVLAAWRQVRIRRPPRCPSRSTSHLPPGGGITRNAAVNFNSRPPPALAILFPRGAEW